MRTSVRLFLLGFLTLFLELVLIRYLAGNIWNLGYFPNLVLLGVFVGMGLGFVFHHRVEEARSERLFQASAWVLLALIAFVTFFHPMMPGFGVAAGNIGGDLYFTAAPQRSNLATPFGFLLWFFSIVLIFSLIAQRTAKVFREFAPLHAYTLDISGSCAGILCFMAMSWLQWPGYAWFLVVTPLFLLAAWPSRSQRAAEQGRGLTVAPGQASWRALAWVIVPMLAVAGLARFQDSRLTASSDFTGALDVRWSPYQKIEYVNTDRLPYQVFVNGIAHQAMETPERIHEQAGVIRYTAPYVDRAKRPELPPFRRVLVLGAGSGNDVAAALSHGVEQVDAVEIDPVIARLGADYHPALPYRDPRVRVTIDDGRAFMTRAREKYDLIVFALTDSLVKVSPMAQLRLENYLFTEDSIRRAHSLLTEDGALLFYNFYRRPWLLQKIEQMLRNVTGSYPRRLYEDHDFAMLLAGKHDVAAQPPAWDGAVDLPTDDWPFLYLERRGIPWVYLLSMSLLLAMITGLMLYLQRKAGLGEPVSQMRKLGPEGQGPSAGSFRFSEAAAADNLISVPLPTKLAFVAMGIAFLLLETKSVIQFSLLFGTTWINNSLVFLAILVSVLAANWAAVFVRSPRAIWVIYALLIGSCGLTLAYPLANLLAVESVGARFALASLMTFSPIFFANLIFSVAFREQKVPEHVFGWNLIGATLGGVVEYLSMILGYNALTGIVAVCYTLTVLCLVLARRAPAPVSSQPPVGEGATA